MSTVISFGSSLYSVLSQNFYALTGQRYIQQYSNMLQVHPCRRSPFASGDYSLHCNHDAQGHVCSNSSFMWGSNTDGTFGRGRTSTQVQKHTLVREGQPGKAILASHLLCSLCLAFTLETSGIHCHVISHWNSVQHAVRARYSHVMSY